VFRHEIVIGHLYLQAYFYLYGIEDHSADHRHEENKTTSFHYCFGGNM